MTIATAPSALDPSLYILDLKPKKRDSALAELVEHAHRAGTVREPGLLLDLLVLRERLGSTALGKGVAAPHARSVTVHRQQLIVARSFRGVEWDAPDGLPVTLILMALSPGECSEATHHAWIARAAAAARLLRNRQKLMAAPSADAVAEVLRQAAR